MNTVLTLVRTTATDRDFMELVEKLNAYLTTINGKEDAFFQQHNTLDAIQHVVLCYSDDEVVGCGAFIVLNKETIEIKRMYVEREYRGQNIGTYILKELEKWARELRFEHIILETSKTMASAVNLYRKNEYGIIPNYEPYKEVMSSICFKKDIGLQILS